ncbi:MAG: amidohydrolase family protein [Coriobacteriia bacterium]
MLVSADWVVPVDAPPIHEGAVLVKGGKIQFVGPLKDIEGQIGRTPHHHFEGCTILPGLVNAHTHLAMTCLAGLIPPMPFADWLGRIPPAMSALSDDDLAASAALGALRSVACGVTVVGDITYGPESVAIAADTGLAGRFYWEVLGATVESLPQTLVDMEFPTDCSTACGIRVRCGLSPHAPYTSGPETLRGTYAIATAENVGYAIHTAESDAETELIKTGTGPLAELAERLAHGFRPPGGTPIDYLDRLGVLYGAVAVHCVNATHRDITALARRGARAVLCPRSNQYLMNGKPPAWSLDSARVPLALGTDSQASNHDLDLFNEARYLADIEPRFTPERLIHMLTLGGAQVLGMDDAFGSLSVGKQADMAIYRVSAAEPYAALLEQAGRRRIEAVVSGGVWRVFSGGPTTGVSVIERASRLATERARLILDGDARQF